MIRPTTPDDMNDLLALAVAAGIAEEGETQELEGVLAEYFDGSLGPDHVWITDDDNGLMGVAYFAAERMTEGTWNLYMIAIDPKRQRQGRGTELVRYAEAEIAKRGGRILLIETSGLPEFETTCAFYRKCGYSEEARIREFWKAGDDKIVYRKALAIQS